MNFIPVKSKFVKKMALALVIFTFGLLPFKSTICGEGTGNENLYPYSCTSVMVGRLASTDGSTITSHTCDGPYRNWVKIVRGNKHPKGTNKSIYTGFHWTETPDSTTGVNKTGEIPESAETYTFLNTAYPAMNEHQLGMGETTIIGKRLLKSTKGLFQIEELQRIALERTRTAREAIKLMGQLAEKYGYIDGSECLTVIDPREVWQFEIYGPGMGELGAVWAAARIPDDHVGVSANYPRIGAINLKKPDYFLASKNIYSVAQKMGWWDPKGKEPFKVWKIYGSQKPSLRKAYLQYCRIREWWVLNSLAPSLKLDINADELPFSVKPDKKVSVWEVMKIMRANYAGTVYDMTRNLGKKDEKTGEMQKSPAANPWMTRTTMALLNNIKPDTVTLRRMIAINRCSYSTVIQARSWLPDAIGGITWLSFDNPAFSARIPVFAGTQELIEPLNYSNQKRFRRDSAAWAFRRAARLAQPAWGRNQKIIDQTIREFEEKAQRELLDLEKRMVKLLKTDPQKAKQIITAYVSDFSRAIIHKYWELGDYFWTLYGSGF